MRAILVPLAAAGALALAGCNDSPAEKAAENQAAVAENQAIATADRMQNHADALNVAANAMSDEAALATTADANIVATQADKTREVVDDVRKGAEEAAR